MARGLKRGWTAAAAMIDVVKKKSKSVEWNLRNDWAPLCGV